MTNVMEQKMYLKLSFTSSISIVCISVSSVLLETLVQTAVRVASITLYYVDMASPTSNMPGVWTGHAHSSSAAGKLTL